MYFCLQPFLVGAMHVRAWNGCRVSHKAHGPLVRLLPLREREPYSVQAQDGLTFQAIMASKSLQEYGQDFLLARQAQRPQASTSEVIISLLTNHIQ